MTEMEKLIEAIKELTVVQQGHAKIYWKGSSESLAHSRFSEGTRFVDAQLGEFVESPTGMKELKKIMKGLSKKVLPFVIKGDWDKALECYIAGVEEFMAQHKGEEDTSNNEAHYS